MGLRRMGDEPFLRENFVEIEAVCQRAEELSYQMLSFAGKAHLTLQSVNLSELVRQTGELMRQSTPAGHAIVYALVDELPAIWGDATQLRQVAMNLILNASEAIGNKTGTISINSGCGFFDAAALRDSHAESDPEPGRYVHFSVRDTGSGMDQSTRERILDPFFTTKPVGHGLGLAVVLGIVRAHKGLLKVESEPGRGSVFTVLFPCTSNAA
jgi:two-component system cell cycle sensor histidine kinase/response regulator CckA